MPLLTSGLTAEASGALADNDDREVHVVPSEMSETGRYAWWCSGENQKARLPEPDTSEDSIAGWSDTVRSHSVVDPEPFDLNDLLSNPSNAEKI